MRVPKSLALSLLAIVALGCTSTVANARVISRRSRSH
jgi:hypothetical protein